MHRRSLLALLAAILFLPLGGGSAASDGDAPIHADILKHLDSIRSELVSVNQDIWTYGPTPS